MISVCMKMEGVELIYCEIDNLPSPTDSLIVVNDPRLQGDKPVPFLRHESRRLVVPIHRLLYIEVIDDVQQDVIRHFRPDGRE